MICSKQLLQMHRYVMWPTTLFTPGMRLCMILPLCCFKGRTKYKWPLLWGLTKEAKRGELSLFWPLCNAIAAAATLTLMYGVQIFSVVISVNYHCCIHIQIPSGLIWGSTIVATACQSNFEGTVMVLCRYCDSDNRVTLDTMHEVAEEYTLVPSKVLQLEVAAAVLHLIRFIS